MNFPCAAATLTDSVRRKMYKWSLNTPMGSMTLVRSYIGPDAGDTQEAAEIREKICYYTRAMPSGDTGTETMEDKGHDKESFEKNFATTSYNFRPVRGGDTAAETMEDKGQDKESVGKNFAKPRLPPWFFILCCACPVTPVSGQANPAAVNPPSLANVTLPCNVTIANPRTIYNVKWTLDKPDGPLVLEKDTAGKLTYGDDYGSSARLGDGCALVLMNWALNDSRTFVVTVNILQPFGNDSAYVQVHIVGDKALPATHETSGIVKSMSALVVVIASFTVAVLVICYLKNRRRSNTGSCRATENMNNGWALLSDVKVQQT